MAASVCSQEDYSSTRCHRLPARPQRSSMNGDTHTHISVDVSLLYSSVYFTCFLSSLFYLDLLSLTLPFSFIPLLFPACSPASLFSVSLSILYHSLQASQAAVREEVGLGQPQAGNICCIFRLFVRPFMGRAPCTQKNDEEKQPHLLHGPLTPTFGHVSLSN